MEKIEKARFASILFFVFASALGGFLFGYDTAVISGTILSVTEQFGLDDIQVGWYVGCALVGSIAGVTSAGWLSDRFGRKKLLLVSAWIFILSSLGCMLSASVTQLILFRMFGGIAIGVASIVSPLYIAEIAVSSYRGRLVSVYQLAVAIGFLVAYLVNFFILDYAAGCVHPFETTWWTKIMITENWRGMLGAAAVPALFFFGIVLTVPESPRWLVVKKRDRKARTILERIYADTAEQELEALKKNISAETRSDWSVLFDPDVLRLVLVGVCLAMLGQFMGVNAVLYYGPAIFSQAGLSEGDSMLYQVVIGSINVVGTVLGMGLIDRIGRKRLIYYGVSGMIVSLFSIGLYFFIGDLLPGVVLLIFVLTYMFCCAVSICVVIWVLLSEMYPSRIRGLAMSVAGLSLWIGTYLIGQLTPWLMTTLSPGYVFWLFGGMCFPYLWIIWKQVPETTGKSLEEIEKNRKVDRQNPRR